MGCTTVLSLFCVLLLTLLAFIPSNGCLTPNKWEQNKPQVLALLLRTESHCGSGGQCTLYFTYTAVVDSSRWVVLHPVFLFILFSLTGLIGGVGDVSRPMAIFELLEYIVEEVRIFPPFFLSLLSVSWLRTPVYLYVGYGRSMSRIG